MSADTYYEKALANLKLAKIITYKYPEDEELITIAGYHIQQALELAIKHVLSLNGVPNQKTHDIDQLIVYAESNEIELYLPNELRERADIISQWETKTRYVMGFALEYNRVAKTIENLEKYFSILTKELSKEKQAKGLFLFSFFPSDDHFIHFLYVGRDVVYIKFSNWESCSL